MKRKRVICIDARMAFHSGIGTYIRNLVPLLARDVRIIALVSSTPFLGASVTWEGVEFIPMKSPIYSIQEQMELAVRIPGVDLFWTPHYNVPLLPIRAKQRLVTIHDVYHIAYGHTVSWVKRMYARTMIGCALRQASHVITNSQFSREEMARWTSVDLGKVSVIHLGVNRTAFINVLDRHQGVDIRSRYALPARYVLFVSTLAPHKNVSRLIGAWLKIARRHEGCSLVLVGKQVAYGGYWDILRQQPWGHRCVQFLGEVPAEDLPLLYRAATAMVYPSLYEGFGLPPLEAMACGCPTLVSRAASIPEVCGSASHYMNPLDEEDMAVALQHILDSPDTREALIRRGYERVEMLSWEKTARQHLEVIEGIV